MSNENYKEEAMENKKKTVIITVGVVAGIMMISGVLGKNDQRVVLSGDPKGQQVNVGQATVNDIQTKISASGTVYAEESEKVFAEINAQIETLLVEVGDTVKKGDVLVTFDKQAKENLQRDLEKLELQLESSRIMLTQLGSASTQSTMQADAAVLNAENNVFDAEEAIRQLETSYTLAQKDLETVENNYDATKTLYDQGLTAKSELDKIENTLIKTKDQLATLETKKVSLEKTLESAKMKQEQATYDRNVLLNNVSDETKSQNIEMKKNEIASLELQKQSLMEQINKSTVSITAPMNGIVSSINVQEGGFVAPGSEMLAIINPDQLIVKAEISPYYAAQLEKGLAVHVKYNGSTTIETTGTVSLVSPIAVQKAATAQSAVTTAIPVEIKLDSANGLKEGLVVDLKVITADVKDVVAVPILATMQDEEKENYIFVVGENGIVEKRYVKQGAADNHSVQVSDVQEGEIIITNPTEALDDGSSVCYLPIKEEGENK